jgi:hypothetical protein
MRYATAAAFRQALDDRLKSEAARTGLPLARLRKQVAFELFLRRLVAVAPDRWVLKGALALELRLKATTRPTRDIDLGRDDDEQAAIEDIAAAQQLALDDFFTSIAIRTDRRCMRPTGLSPRTVPGVAVALVLGLNRTLRQRGVPPSNRGSRASAGRRRTARNLTA